MKKDVVLSIKDVSYRYSDAAKDEYALKNINYEFEKGKSYAIKGKSGSGKTTLLSLISGLEKKYNGDIFYNVLTPYADGLTYHNAGYTEIGENYFIGPMGSNGDYFALVFDTNNSLTEYYAPAGTTFDLNSIIAAAEALEAEDPGYILVYTISSGN